MTTGKNQFLASKQHPPIPAIDAAFNTVGGWHIPNDWPITALGDLCSFSNGVNAERTAYGLGIPFINVLEVIRHTHLIEMDIPGKVSLRKALIESFAVRRGDILFNRTSETQEEVGLSAVYLDDATVVFGGFVIRGRFINDSMDATYVGYAFRAPFIRSQIVAQGQGAIRANIGQANLKLVLVPVPNRSEQRAIAEALSGVDGLLGALEALIAKKRAIKKAAMQQLLTRKTRLAGVRASNGHKDSELGVIPTDWDCVRMGQVVDLLTGFPFPSTGYSSRGVLLVRGSNVKRGQMDWQGDITKYWPAVTPELARFQLRDGDLVIAMDGALVGRSFAVVSAADLPSLLLQRVARLRSSIVDQGLLTSWVASDSFATYVDSVKTHTAIPHISAADIRNFLIAVPSDPAEQRAIAGVLTDMDAEIAALERRRDKTRAIKQGMMQQLLTGRVRLVKPESIEAGA